MSEQSTEQTYPPTAARRSRLAIFALVLALSAVGLAAWNWVEIRTRTGALQQDLARRLVDSEATVRETRLLAGESRDDVRDVQARLGQLEARMVESQNQRLALESLYREMSSSRDEWALAEVEQVLLIANQQLQLAGNVKAALIALETADARLARMDRPQLTPLRRTIGRDIEQLKAAPYVDVIGMALRLDNIAASIDGWPLSMHGRSADQEEPADAVPGGFWSKLWRETVRDMRDLIRIQNAKQPAVPLVAPEQAYFIRENLRMRLLGARLALLAHDQASFRADIAAASDWMARYYESGSRSVAAAQAELKQLIQSEVSIELPDISASLDAARGIRLVRERTLR